MQSKTHHVRRRHSTHTRVVAPSVSFLRLCTIRMPDWREFNPACTPLQYFQTAYSYIMKYQSIFLILLLVYCQWPVWLVSTFKLQYWRYRVNQPRETLLFCQRIFEIRHTTIFDIKDTTLRAAAHWKGATVPLIQVASWTGKRPRWVSSGRTYSWHSFAKRTCHCFKWLRPSATSSLTATPWSTSQPSPSRSSASSSSSLARKCNQHLQKFEIWEFQCFLSICMREVWGSHVFVNSPTDCLHCV